MSVKKFKFVSPGIFVNEIDNSQLPAQSPDVGPVIIGRTERGPALRPVRVESFSEFVEIFGNPIPGGQGGDVWRNGNYTSPTYGAYAAQAYLRNNSPITFVRLLEGQDTKAVAVGKAGWRAGDGTAPIWSNNDETLASGGAYGLFICDSGSIQGQAGIAGTNLTGALAAIFYTTDGSIALTGSRAGTYGPSLTAQTWGTGIAGPCGLADSVGANKEFAIAYRNSAGGVTATASFNFNLDSEKYIRKVFNTNPTLTNTSITRTENQTNIWLGETYDRHLNDIVTTANAGGQYGIVLPMCSQGVTGAIEGDYRFGLQAARSGWVISQDTVSASFSYTPIDATTRVQKLFRFHSLGVGTGMWDQKNLKVSISEISPSTNKSNPYGTFSVMLRRASDSDAAVQVVERFDNLNLNPNSTDYIGRRIGDKYPVWDDVNRLYQDYGKYDNYSKFIRVEVDPDIDEGGSPDATLLPFGFWGPPKYKDAILVSGSANVYPVDKDVEKISGVRAATTLVFDVSAMTDQDGISITDAFGTTKSWVYVEATDNEACTTNIFGATGFDTDAGLAVAFYGSLTSSIKDGTINVSVPEIGTAAGQFNWGTDTSFVVTQGDPGTIGNTAITGSATAADSGGISGSDNLGAMGLTGGSVGGAVVPGEEFRLAINASTAERLQTTMNVTGGFNVVSSSVLSDGTKTMIKPQGPSAVGTPQSDDGFFFVDWTHFNGADPDGDGSTVDPKPVRLMLRMPSMALRHSASDGRLTDTQNAFWGVDTSYAASGKFHAKSYGDLVYPKPAAVDSFDVGTFTQHDAFTLDDLVHDETTNEAFYVSGSRALAQSMTAISGTYNEVLDQGCDRFTMPLFGGWGGVDITEKDPFRNTLMDSTSTPVNNSVYYTYKRAIDSVADPEVVEMNTLTAPGLTLDNLTTHMINVCEDRADTLAILDLDGNYIPSSENNSDMSDRLGTVTQTINNLKDRGLDSSYACAYYPWVQIRDQLNGSLLWAPPSIVALGTMGSSASRSELWFAPAGFNRGGLTEGSAGIDVVNVVQRLTSKDRDKLYDANINPIASFPAEGLVVFGQKTLQVTPSALDRINVRRLLIFLKREISRISATLLFDQNVQATWNRFLAQVKPFLASVKARLGLMDYKVVLDNTTTTPDLIDRNIMYAKIFLKPAKAIEFIALDFVITDSGASFED
jgi:hypothetical protein